MAAPKKKKVKDEFDGESYDVNRPTDYLRRKPTPNHVIKINNLGYKEAVPIEIIQLPQEEFVAMKNKAIRCQAITDKLEPVRGLLVGAKTHNGVNNFGRKGEVTAIIVKKENVEKVKSLLNLK